MRYRKRPVIIEAYQTDVELDIETLEGTMHASVGDYIITGVKGERYPCKPDVFEQTYEAVDESSENGACWRCRWYEHDKDAENAEVGWCHRYPPQMVVSDGNIPTTAWLPSTTFLEYCGEFEEVDA